jgi:RNA polymerase sigma-70 factor (ECF subfamily)
MPADARATAAESDPVTAALADDVVCGRLTAAARAFLVRRPNPFSEAQHAAEAEEIVSKARLEALKRRYCYDPSRDVVAWLVGFVVNVAKDHVKKHVRTTAGPPPGGPALDDLAVDLGRPVSDAVADREFVDRLLGRLPDGDREVIRQKYTDDLTFAQIAEALGSNENAIRVRHHRIIQRLRDMCGEVRL